MKKTEHDLHHFMHKLNRNMEMDYEYLQKRASEDPGTTGDQAELHWANWLREWLPPTYEVVTKGRIIDQTGQASPQIDILVLKSFYPKRLHSEKHYLSAGVAAAFECKTTLKADHIQEAMETSTKIKKLCRHREGTPYKELHAPIIYGLLAHSHRWANPPEDLIMNKLLDSDSLYVDHPRLGLDFLCVANYGTWTRFHLLLPQTPTLPVQVNSGYINFIPSNTQNFTAVGSFYATLMERLAWEDSTLRDIVDYYRSVRIGGESEGGNMRQFSFEVFSDSVQQHIRDGLLLNNPLSWDKWNISFGTRMVFPDQNDG